MSGFLLVLITSGFPLAGPREKHSVLWLNMGFVNKSGGSPAGASHWAPLREQAGPAPLPGSRGPGVPLGVRFCFFVFFQFQVPSAGVLSAPLFKLHVSGCGGQLHLA